MEPEEEKKSDTFVVVTFAALSMNSQSQQSHKDWVDVQQLNDSFMKGHSHTVNTSSYRSHTTKPGQPTIEYSDQIVEFNFE